MSELIRINTSEVMDIFTKRELIMTILKMIESKSTGLNQDVTTESGRKCIASMAYRVSQSKTYIEGHGKNLASQLKSLPKIVDSNRKYAKDFLDDLKDRVREPLTKWEEEQKKIKLQKKVLEDHEVSLLDNLEWDLKKRKEKLRIEKERLDYKDRIFAEAKAKAKIEADEIIKREKIKANAIEMEAKANIIILQQKAKFDIERAKKEAVTAERNKQKEIEKKRSDKEIKIQKQKNIKKNIDKVNKLITEDFISLGFSEEQSQYIISVIRDGKIRHLQIL
jgi:hypothetical protein